MCLDNVSADLLCDVITFQTWCRYNRLGFFFIFDVVLAVGCFYCTAAGNFVGFPLIGDFCDGGYISIFLILQMVVSWFGFTYHLFMGLVLAVEKIPAERKSNQNKILRELTANLDIKVIKLMVYLITAILFVLRFVLAVAFPLWVFLGGCYNQGYEYWKYIIWVMIFQQINIIVSIFIAAPLAASLWMGECALKAIKKKIREKKEAREEEEDRRQSNSRKKRRVRSKK